MFGNVSDRNWQFKSRLRVAQLTANLAALLVGAVAAAVLARAEDVEGAAVAVLAPERAHRCALDSSPLGQEYAPEERRQRIGVAVLQLGLCFELISYTG